MTTKQHSYIYNIQQLKLCVNTQSKWFLFVPYPSHTFIKSTWKMWFLLLFCGCDLKWILLSGFCRHFVALLLYIYFCCCFQCLLLSFLFSSWFSSLSLCPRRLIVSNIVLYIVRLLYFQRYYLCILMCAHSLYDEAIEKHKRRTQIMFVCVYVDVYRLCRPNELWSDTNAHKSII